MYGPGPSILLLCISLATTLQLFLPLQHLAKMPHFALPNKYLAQPLTQLSFLRSRPQLRDLVRQAPFLFLQLLALVPLNFVAVDLLATLLRLERRWKHASGGSGPEDISAWAEHAGHLGPPIVTLFWNFFPALVRACVCIVYISVNYASLRTQGPGATTARAATALALRHLALDGVGLLLPTGALGVLATRPWLYSAAHAARERYESGGPTVFPADLAPALYWHGQGESLHGSFIAFAAVLGLWALAVSALLLMCQAAPPGSGKVFGVATKVWWAPFVGLEVLLLLLWALAQALLVVSGRGAALVAGLEHAMETVLNWFYVVAAPIAVIPGMPAMAIIFMPALSIWYVIMGWVFRSVDTASSCVFIPCADTSIWQLDQLCLVAAGAALVGFHVLLLRQWMRPGSKQVVPERRVVPERVAAEMRAVPEGRVLQAMDELPRHTNRTQRVWVRRGAITSLPSEVRRLLFGESEEVEPR